MLSYSLYLWQMPLADPANGSFFARFPLNIAVAVGLAAVSYYFVEQPILKLRAHRSHQPQRLGSMEAVAGPGGLA
jgi:peptidoglycan/LPS O-acetylase OafA/YrhL